MCIYFIWYLFGKNAFDMAAESTSCASYMWVQLWWQRWKRGRWASAGILICSEVKKFIETKTRTKSSCKSQEVPVVWSTFKLSRLLLFEGLVALVTGKSFWFETFKHARTTGPGSARLLACLALPVHFLMSLWVSVLVKRTRQAVPNTESIQMINHDPSSWSSLCKFTHFSKWFGET